MQTNIDNSSRARALALYVALDRPDSWRSGCVAWVESRDAQCCQPRREGLLCVRHHKVALRRLERDVEARSAASVARAVRRARAWDGWVCELDRVSAEIVRRDPPRPVDRAAYTGVVHPSIEKTRRRALSGGNVAAMARLWARHDELVAQLSGGKPPRWLPGPVVPRRFARIGACPGCGAEGAHVVVNYVAPWSLRSCGCGAEWVEVDGPPAA